MASEIIFPNPNEPFTFINVFEIQKEQIETFVSQWRERSKMISSADGFLGAELQKALLPDTRFQIINIARWSSYTAFKNATLNSKFQAELSKLKGLADLSIIPYRGFYRMVATANPQEN